MISLMMCILLMYRTEGIEDSERLKQNIREIGEWIVKDGRICISHKLNEIKCWEITLWLLFRTFHMQCRALNNQYQIWISINFVGEVLTSGCSILYIHWTYNIRVNSSLRMSYELERWGRSNIYSGLSEINFWIARYQFSQTEEEC